MSGEKSDIFSFLSNIYLTVCSGFVVYEDGIAQHKRFGSVLVDYDSLDLFVRRFLVLFGLFFPVGIPVQNRRRFPKLKYDR